MRELVIDKFKVVVKRINDFDSWKKNYNPIECPDFDKISDQELLDQFVSLLRGSVAPGG